MWRLGSWIAWVLTWSASAPRSLGSLRTVSSPNRDYEQSQFAILAWPRVGYCMAKAEKPGRETPVPI